MTTTTTYEPARRITGWHIQVVCKACGGTLAHAADSRPGPTVSAAVARCIGCGRCWHAEVTLTDITHEVGRKALW